MRKRRRTTLVFDADGVVIDSSYRFMRYLQQELKVPPERSGEFFGGAFRECLIGRADLKEVIVPFLAEWGWSGSVEGLLRLWFDLENIVNQDLLRLVRSLREQGYPCAVATNQEKHRLAYIRDEMRFSVLFDAVFGSAELGEAKPSAGFYRLVTERLGVRPEDIIFWDDSEANVEAARAFGWRAERYTGADDVVRTLKRCLPDGSLTGI